MAQVSAELQRAVAAAVLSRYGLIADGDAKKDRRIAQALRELREGRT